MLTLFGILHHYDDLNMTEGMRVRVHLQFDGRKISYEAIFYLPVKDDQDDRDDVPLIALVVVRAARY